MNNAANPVYFYLTFTISISSIHKHDLCFIFTISSPGRFNASYLFVNKYGKKKYLIFNKQSQF